MRYLITFLFASVVAFGQVPRPGPIAGGGGGGGGGSSIPSVNARYVSSLIPAADAIAGCNVLTGLNLVSVQCADDAAPLNVFLATSTVNNCIDLYFDVSVGLSTALLAPQNSCVTIEGNGATGAYVRNGSNSSILCTIFSGANYSAKCDGGLDGSTPGTQVGSLIVKNWVGNGNWTGNSSTGDHRCSTPGPGWCVGVLAANLAVLQEENTRIVNSPSYGWLMSNITRTVHIGGSTEAHSNTDINTDGIHWDGLIGSITVSDYYIYGNDDGLAINAPEGYVGNIGPSSFSNITYGFATSCIRAYTYAGVGSYVIDKIVMTNLNGTVGDRCLLLGDPVLGKGSGGMFSVKVSNSTLQITNPIAIGTSMAEVSDTVRDLEFDQVQLLAPIASSPWLHFSQPATVDYYKCTACSILRTDFGNQGEYWAQIGSGSVIGTYETNGGGVFNQNGQSYSAIPYAIDLQSGGSIVNLVQDTPLGGTTATPLVTSLFNGAQSVRVTNCLGYTCSGAFISSGGISAGATPPAFTPGTGGGFALACGTAPSAGPASAVAVTYCDSTQQGLLANFYNAGYLPITQGPASSTNGDCAKFSGTKGGLLLDSGSPCGSGSGGGQSGWTGTSVTLVTTVAQYTPFVGGGTTSGVSAESTVSVAAPAAATIANLKVSMNAAVGGSATFSATLRDGASSTALTCTTASGASSCSDTTHSVNVAQGDLLDFLINTTGVITAATPQVTIAYTVGTSGVGVTSVTCNGALSGGTFTTTGTCDVAALGITTAKIAANAVTSAKEAVVNTRRVCDVPVGDTSGSAITNAQLGPQKRMCYIPAASTIVEMDVAADAGTPNVVVAVNHAGSDSNIVSGALATAASGGIACSNTGGTTGIDGATTCTNTLQNTSIAAGDYLELVSGTAGGTAKLMTIHIIYTIN